MGSSTKYQFITILLSFVCICSTPYVCTAQDTETADLEEQLKNGLMARAPNELAFITKVVNLVDQGTLNVATVKAAFQYARPKLPRPYPYFERALRELAKRNGVIL